MVEVLDYLKTNQEAYTVVGILLTLFISLISLWFTVKNNKAVQYVDSVTKNRVEWIDKLRKNISDFLSLLDIQDLTDTILTPEEASKYPFGTNLQRLNQLGCEIKLMLNFSDSFDREIMYQIDSIILGYKNLYISSQSSILKQMKSGEKLFVPDKEVTDKQEALISSKEKLLSDMQIYLKSEWNRVKYESKGKTYEKETQLFDLTELKEKKTNASYKNNIWKRFCINTKAKSKRILHSHQFSVIIFIIALIVLVLCVPEIIKDIANLIKNLKA